MIRANATMLERLKLCSHVDVMEPSLKAVAQLGLIKLDECIFLSALNPEPRAFGDGEHDLRFFGDATGFEAFCNGFHVEDYVSSNVLENALFFAAKTLDQAELNFSISDCRASISIDDDPQHSIFPVVFKLYCIRNGIGYLLDDISLYDQPVLECDLSGARELQQFYLQSSSGR